MSFILSSFLLRKNGTELRSTFFLLRNPERDLTTPWLKTFIKDKSKWKKQ